MAVAKTEFDLRRFVLERDAALLSMDEEKIREYGKNWGVRFHPDPAVFWNAVHKARTGAKSLPMWERAASKRWLMVRLSPAMDGGEVRIPTRAEEYRKYVQRCAELGCPMEEGKP